MKAPLDILNKHIDFTTDNGLSREQAISAMVEYANQFKAKAEKYDALENIVGNFYDESEENISDLGDIGESVASFFGYL